MEENAALRATRAPDPRPARTRAAIIAAIDRLGQQGKELSVSLIVTEAGLSRSSFYSQFTDIGDVAVQLMREHYEHGADAAKHHPETASLAAESTFLLTEFDRRRYLYSAVLGGSAEVSAEWAVCQIIAQAWLPIIASQAPSNLEPEFAARYIAAGHLAGIVAWLRSTNPVPLREVEAQFVGLLPLWAAPDTK